MEMSLVRKPSFYLPLFSIQKKNLYNDKWVYLKGEGMPKTPTGSTGLVIDNPIRANKYEQPWRRIEDL